MKVRRRTPTCTAIQWDNSKLAKTRIDKLYSFIAQNGDNLIVTTLDAVITIKLTGWFVLEKNGRVSGYSNDAFEEKFEKVVEVSK